MALLKPGLGFRELAEKSSKNPDRFEEFEVGVVVHGIGMCNEYPQVAPLKWFYQTGYDGEFQPGMTVSVESYIGEKGAKEGVQTRRDGAHHGNRFRVGRQIPFRERTS